MNAQGPGAKAQAPQPLYGLTILLSAFLLFQVQPLIAKLILPWFGGSAAVWASCMLFFQLMLLGGYSYAHWLNRQPPARQALVHGLLLALSLVCLPILPAAWWKPSGTEDPLLRILGLLLTTVGLPYFLLSATSPLLQAWYSRARGGALPYRYFALSNAGSMAGLLSYPVLVEPYLGGHAQAWTWSAGYAGFALLCAWMAWRQRLAAAVVVVAPAAAPASAPGLREKLLWLALAACGSSLMLAVTDHLSQNVAAIPFLWVLPLSLYLLSFILCFDSERWYRRRAFAVLALPALLAVAHEISRDRSVQQIKPTLALFCAAGFVLMMVCHGELARRRPAPAHLTTFYLMVAAGGALGGVLIAFAAPYLLDALYDLPVVVCLLAALLAVLAWLERAARRHGRALAAGAALLALVLAGYLGYDSWGDLHSARVLERNFYGALRVSDQIVARTREGVRVLKHGTITHGTEYLSPQRRDVPTTYYGKDSGIGLSLRIMQRQGTLRVGLVGLGAGTLLSYARPGDWYRIYEINPLVPGLARAQFHYLTDSAAPAEIVLGDARLSLEREPSQQFDLLAVDAFSSDAIPVHLLTREAFQLYWRQLKPDGVLAVHVSNKYLNLAPVVALAAAADGKTAKLVLYQPAGGGDAEDWASDWVLVSSRPGFFEQAQLISARDIESIPELRPWTDDYSNLFRVLR